MKKFDRRIWVDVSGDFKLTTLLKLILGSSSKQTIDGSEKQEDMVKQLRLELERNRFLLILDDMGMLNVKPKKWEEFKQTLMDISKVRGNTILVITDQNEQQAAYVTALESYLLEKLTPEDCWSIMKEKASAGGETAMELEDIGRQIAEKCQGLPLAAHLLGSLLQNKGRQFWLSILESGVLNAEDIVPEILKLIFDYLPTLFLQRCFAFCSLLSRNSIIDKMQLVQLWMAEGFIDSEMRNDAMKEVGNQYFDILLSSSLLQAVTKDEDNKITQCKMHNLVHDYASSISRFESINCHASVQDEVPEIRHLALESFGKKTTKIVQEKAGHLKTLFLKSNVPDNILLNFNSLHVLNLCGADIEELPALIGKLRKLQYLDISRTKIKSLPASVCNLYKLQTLKITDCEFLKELPENFKNLLSLRHLHYYCDEFFHMPWEIGRLTNLHTLPIYNIGEANGPPIGELKSLKNLKGKLEIRNLDLVKDKKEAEQADLFGKSNLQELQLRWIYFLREGDNNDENVLDGLQPHPNLSSLMIEYFMGDRFPSWLMNMSVCVGRGGEPARLNNLVEVKLIRCRHCKEIPTLGLLPLLHYLELSELLEVTCIGPSFYDETGSKSKDTAGRQTTKTLFPALRSLNLDRLPSLVDWMGVDQAKSELAYEVQVFPSLERLSIFHCSRLTTAPSHEFPSLKDLIIDSLNSSSSMENICNSKLTTLRNLQIDGVKELTHLPDGLLKNNPNLACLQIKNCHDLTHIVSHVSWGATSLQKLVIKDCGRLQELPADLDSLQSLEKLEISQCPQLKSLQTSNGINGGLTCLSRLTISECSGLTIISSELIESCKSLQFLQLTHCENLIDFSVDLQKMPNLSSLELSYCGKLKFMPKGLGELNNLVDLEIGPLSEEFETIRTFFAGIQNLSSLLRLSLHGDPNWDSLPEELQHLTSLKEMSLWYFGIEGLPDWIEKLSSIQELNISVCENLQYFPSKEIMQSLKKLRKLRVDDSPIILKRWAMQNDPDCEWFKVSHIPKIFAELYEVSAPGFWIDILEDIEKEKKSNTNKKTKKKTTQSSSSTS